MMRIRNSCLWKEKSHPYFQHDTKERDFCLSRRSEDLKDIQIMFSFQMPGGVQFVFACSVSVKGCTQEPTWVSDGD